MVGASVPVLFLVLAAAAVTAFLIYGYVPSYHAWTFRRMLAMLAVRRAFASCRHAFDADARRLDRYSRAMVDLETASELRLGAERRIAETFGHGAARGAALLAEIAMLERHFERRKAAALRYLKAMSDEDIAVVARSYRGKTLDGRVPEDAVAAFFRDERDLVRMAPHMVVGHFDRMEHRFNALWDEAEAASGRPLASPAGT